MLFKLRSLSKTHQLVCDPISVSVLKMYLFFFRANAMEIKGLCTARLLVNTFTFLGHMV